MYIYTQIYMRVCMFILQFKNFQFILNDISILNINILNILPIRFYVIT
jgi:hypothetical protein